MIGEKIIEKIHSPKTSTPEVLPLRPENAPEKIANFETSKNTEAPKPLEKSGEGNIVVSAAVSDAQKQRLQAIDDILADGLGEIFLGLEPVKQKEFKLKGEETVKKINLLLQDTKFKINKVIDLIRSWLKLIPGVNYFFLEQEAKIKADKIMRLKNRF